MISSHSCTIKLPSPIDDDRLSDELSNINTQPSDCPSLMEYYIFTIRLYGILGEALDKLESRTPSSTKSVNSVHDILELDTQIMEWRESLPSYLKHDPTNEDGPPLTFTVIHPEVLDISGLSRRLYCRYDFPVHLATSSFILMMSKICAYKTAHSPTCFGAPLREPTT